MIGVAGAAAAATASANATHPVTTDSARSIASPPLPRMNLPTGSAAAGRIEWARGSAYLDADCAKTRARSLEV